MSERIKVSVRDHVADVKLDRAEKLNALDQAMFEALADTGRELARDRSLRAVVLSGEGRAFCAGLDFTGFMAMAGGDAPAGTVKRNPMERGPGSPANFAQIAVYVWIRASPGCCGRDMDSRQIEGERIDVLGFGRIPRIDPVHPEARLSRLAYDRISIDDARMPGRARLYYHQRTVGVDVCLHLGYRERCRGYRFHRYSAHGPL